VNNELDKLRKESAVDHFTDLEVFQNFPERQRKATKIFCQDSRSPYLGSNLGPTSS
jgi:hypothetical protein